MIRMKEFRLVKRGSEYLQQWRYVYGDTKKVSKWWEVWKENYEIVYEYGEWNDLPIVEIT